MNQAPQEAGTSVANDTIQVDDLDTFVHLVSRWHQGQVNLLKHALTVPPGTTFEIGDGAEAESLELSGNALRGFKFGIELALIRMGTLPFAAELEDTKAEPAKPVQTDLFKAN